ncbi:MAG: hypothetical protein IPM24_14920 [Bryobacterales bacterium]|nr:hypothetical protein [Bryobacterales bacterium]
MSERAGDEGGSGGRLAPLAAAIDENAALRRCEDAGLDFVRTELERMAGESEGTRGALERRFHDAGVAQILLISLILFSWRRL